MQPKVDQMSPRPNQPERRTGETLVVQIAAKLRAAIQQGGFAPGDKLPTESQLVSAHGVSRTVIREALASLRTDGLVEARQGAGVFVLPPPARPAHGFQGVDFERLSSVIEMLELRSAVEIEAAGLAALRRAPQQEELILAAHARIASLAAAGEATAGADFELHLAIAQATNNHRFVEFLGLIGEAMIPRRALDKTQPDAATLTATQIHAEHGKIVEAISMGDEEAARAAMRAHLRGSQQRYKAALHGML